MCVFLLTPLFFDVILTETFIIELLDLTNCESKSRVRTSVFYAQKLAVKVPTLCETVLTLF